MVARVQFRISFEDEAKIDPVVDYRLQTAKFDFSCIVKQGLVKLKPKCWARIKVKLQQLKPMGPEFSHTQQIRHEKTIQGKTIRNIDILTFDRK